MSHQSIHSVVDPEQFSLRFRMLMSYHDLTLKDIADCTHNAVSTVGTWKNGRVPSSEESRRLLAKIFHVSVNFLLYGVPQTPASEHMSQAPTILNSIDKVMSEVDSGNGVSEPESRLKREKDVPYRRDSIEKYLKLFLDQAEAEPGGLAHTWYHLRREFPLDLFSRLH